ncbi:unnamed protein product [Closterium sp. NIES-54]
MECTPFHALTTPTPYKHNSLSPSQVLSDGLTDCLQHHPRRVHQPQSPYRRHILLQDIRRRRASCQQPIGQCRPERRNQPGIGASPTTATATTTSPSHTYPIYSNGFSHAIQTCQASQPTPSLCGHESNERRSSSRKGSSDASSSTGVSPSGNTSAKTIGVSSSTAILETVFKVEEGRGGVGVIDYDVKQLSCTH